jgi:capsular exopolysaccharide synthesis family protein
VDPRIVTFHAPRDPRAEQIRGVRTSILSFDPIPKSIAVTSGSPGEGKSLTAVNLAASLVEGGRRRVLLVDANLRFPELATLCGAEDGLGLSDLMGGVTGDPIPLIRPTGIPGVELLGAGQSLENPGSLLNPRGLSGVLGLVEDGYDFVIVDTPALDEYADAAVLAPEVDGTVLVCQVEGPPRNQAEKALDLLAAARARVLGVIATNCRT